MPWEDSGLELVPQLEDTGKAIKIVFPASAIFDPLAANLTAVV